VRLRWNFGQGLCIPDDRCLPFNIVVGSVGDLHSGMLDTNVLDKNAVGLVCPLFGDQGQPIG